MIAGASLLVLLAAAPGPAATDSAASAATLADMRNVGTAMMSWLVDQIVDGPALADGEAAADPVDPAEAVDWSQCPTISRDDLRAILVPTYIKEIPQEDGWGSDLEFCLERLDFNRSRYLLGVRSPGRDGTFERAGHPPGAFAHDDFDADLIWLDGFFARWPDNAEP